MAEGCQLPLSAFFMWQNILYVVKYVSLEAPSTLLPLAIAVNGRLQEAQTKVKVNILYV
jgi:hypothetical protein